MSNDLCFEKSKPDDNSDVLKLNNNSETNIVEAALKKRTFALSELLSTEKLYIQDLAEVVNVYIEELYNPKNDIPEDLKNGKARMVFGNIKAIYEWHRDYFLKSLQRCNKTPSELGPMIKRYEGKFLMYNTYCLKKPLSEFIVSEHIVCFDQIRQKANHRLDLRDLLIKPIQRITKYGLLFKEIKKQTELAKLVKEIPSIEEAYHVMNNVCRAVDDMMVLGRLQKFEGTIANQGNLLLHGKLWCIEVQKNIERNVSMVQKPRELQLFIFEKIIIIADVVGRTTQFTSPSYFYRSHLQVNKMQLDEIPNNKFLLRSTDSNRPDLHQYVCFAETIEQTNEWQKTIRKLLENQYDFLKVLKSPIKLP